MRMALRPVGRAAVENALADARNGLFESEGFFNFNYEWLWLCPDQVPFIRDMLDPVVATLRAVNPKHDNQDFDITHPGGRAWETLRGEKHWGRDPTVRRRQWHGFSQCARGIAAPVEHLRHLLQEGEPAVMQALPTPLRYEPMLSWGQTAETTDPARWVRSVQDLVGIWPGRLTLVLHGGNLGIAEWPSRPGEHKAKEETRRLWGHALATLLIAVGPTLDGLELWSCPPMADDEATAWLRACASTLRTLTVRNTRLPEIGAWSSPTLERLLHDGVGENGSSPGADSQAAIRARFPRLRHLEARAEAIDELPAGIESVVLRHSSLGPLEELLARSSAPAELCLAGDSLSWTTDRHRLMRRLAALRIQTLGLASPWFELFDDSMGGEENWSMFEALIRTPHWPDLKRLWMPWSPYDHTHHAPRVPEIRAWLGDTEWIQASGMQLCSGAWVWGPGWNDF